MNARPTGVSDSGNRSWLVFVAVAVLLIASFLYRALTPAHEYPTRPEQLLTMGLDFVLLAALIGMKRQLTRGAILFWIALAAGIGLFAIRLTSDASWWTGHLVYYLEPR
jgi:hypothetical protein